jgi:hypothetical protein
MRKYHRKRAAKEYTGAPIIELTPEEVNAMIEEFMAKAKKKKRRNPSDNPETPRKIPVFSRWSGRGRPRSKFSKHVTMVKGANGTLMRANRGRPGANEIRVKIEVPHDLTVQRPPITYTLNSDGELVKAQI